MGRVEGQDLLDVKKQHSHFWCAKVSGLCGSIDRNLLFYSSASSHPIFVSLFHAQCGKAFRCIRLKAALNRLIGEWVL